MPPCCSEDLTLSHILDVSLRTISVSPTGAELLVGIALDHLQPEWEIRGKLHGPHSPFSTTIELAYPLRSLQQSDSETPNELQRRVIIPEVSLWEPEAPFLYTGIIEIRENNQRIERATFSYGFREIRLSSRGLFVNGRAVEARGIQSCPQSEEQMMDLRQQGYNTLVLSDLSEMESAVSFADRYGFLMLGELDTDETDWDRRRKIEQHPCFLGWVCQDVDHVGKVLHTVQGTLGIRSDETDLGSLPDGVRFLLRSTVPISIAGT